MPQDLFGGNPNFGMQQQDSAPKDLFGGDPNFGTQNVPQGKSQTSSNPEDSRGFWNNFARHRAANIGEAAKNVASDILKVGYPQVSQVMEGLNKAGASPDFYKGLGVQKGLPDDLIQGGLEMAPFVSGAEGASKALSEIPTMANMFSKFAQGAPKTAKFAGEVAKNVGAGDAYAANQGDTDNLGTNTLLSAASVPLGYAAAAPAKYISKYLAQSSIPGLTERATDKLKGLSDPQNYAKQFKDNYTAKANENTANWNNLDNITSKLDSSITPQTPFDNSSYIKHIDNFLDNVKQLEPAKQANYQQAIDFAQRAKDLAPQSFSGAVDLRKVLNQELTNYLGQKGIPAANRESKQFINGLKDNLSGDTINSNLSKLPDEMSGLKDDFSTAWDKANQSHQQLQDFYKAKNPLGTISEKQSLKKALKGGDVNDSAILDQFMPSPKQTGTAGLDQLAKGMGSQQSAQDAAKAYLNRRPLNNGNTVLDSSTEYAKLSPSQRQWIYGDSPEGNLLGAVNDVRTAFGKEPDRSFYKMFSHPAASMLVAPAIGGAAGYYSHGNEGAMTGAALPLIASAIARKSAGKLSPDMVRGMIRYAQSAPQNVGRNINVLLNSLHQGGQQQ